MIPQRFNVDFFQYDFVEHQRDYIHGDITPMHDNTEKVSIKSGV